MNGLRSSDHQGYRRSIRSCAGVGPDKPVINPIMLRFRPIAPKPATCPDVPGGLTSDNNKDNNLSNILPNGRRKRKYVRVRKYTRKKLPTSSSSYDHDDQVMKTRNEGFDHHDQDHEIKTTLQLLPEMSDLNRPIEIDLSSVSQENRDLPTCLISNKPARDGTRLSDRVQYSWVTLECVTGTCIDGHLGLGSTDLEKVMNLERDTCPGFVSDGSNCVMWVNGAFKRMVKCNNNEGLSPEVVVQLVIKESLPSFYSAFTGHVKLQYAMGVERYSRTVPCDLWRMDGGGFAWRLDVEAALTLGR